MSGGLLSLVAQGAQDAYLTGSPQITFFRIVYRRYTNFALEAIEQTFNGAADFGRRVTATISRNGDLVTNMYLQVTLPDLVPSGTAPSRFHYVNSVGHALMRNVEVEIGGQKIDKIPSEFMEIFQQLSLPEEKKNGYNEMVGSYPNDDGSVSGNLLATNKYKRTYYIPLIFWFNRVPGNALPLIALQYHEIKINIEFRPISELVSSSAAISYAANPSIVSASLFVDYVYLDTDERRKYAAASHEFLIEQLQFTGSETGNPGSNKIRLSFNHPVKELLWTVTPTDSATANTVTGNAWFDCGEPGTDLMTSAKLLLNGHDRFQERQGPYFRLVQPYQHHTRIPNRYIYVYSFALKPEEHQPSGTCNFSRIDNAALHITLDSDAPSTKISVYAINYNILRILSGMAGLAYSD
jgi:hypothetical protein